MPDTRMREWMRLRRVLISFYNEPSFVPGRREPLEQRRKIDLAVAGDREHVAEHGVEKARVALLRPRELLLADVLAVHVHDALRVAPERAHRIAAREREVPGVEQQAHGGSRLHHAVDLFLAFDHR